MHYITDYFKEFLNLCNEMSAYLLLGFIFAGILHVFIKQKSIVKYLGKNNFKSVANAALIGVPLPLCSCGVIPTGVSLAKNGASKGAAVSFLISTPQTGVDSIFATYSLLGLPFALARPIVAFVSGILGGLLTNAFNKEKQEETQPEINENEYNNTGKFKRFLNYAFVEFLQDISKWLVIGLAVAALISLLLPNDFFTAYIGNYFVSMVLVLVAAIPMYVCATGSIPIAAVLMMKGLSPGLALIFLMAGPATNAATISVIGSSMGKKTLYTYLFSIIISAVLFGLLIDFAFPKDYFISNIITCHDHNHLIPAWFKLASTIILGMLIINGYVQKYFIKQKSKITAMKTTKIIVEGMTCNHCKANVEKNLGKIENVKQVEANIVTNVVEIEGENLDLKQIEAKITDLGYNFVKKLD